MAIIINDNLKISAPKPTDSRYFNEEGLMPWGSISDVNENIISAERFIGLTVNIGGVEYWYRLGVRNVDLEKKIVHDLRDTFLEIGTLRYDDITRVLYMEGYWQWRINNLNYSTEDLIQGLSIDYYFQIDELTNPLFTRIDVCYVEEFGDNRTAKGVEVLIDPVKPAIPARALEVSFVVVSNAVGVTPPPAVDLTGYAPKESPTFTGSVIVPNAVNSNQAVNLGQLDNAISASASTLQQVTENGNTTDIGIVVNTGADTGVYAFGNDTGVYAFGNDTGVYASGDNTGVYATGGTYGVNASGDTGVYAAGNNTGVYASGTDTGVNASGNTGVYAYGGTYGVNATGDTGASVFGGNTGVYATGDTGNAGIFNIPSTNNSNIVEFRKDDIIQASISHEGKVVGTDATDLNQMVTLGQLNVASQWTRTNNDIRNNNLGNVDIVIGGGSGFDRAVKFFYGTRELARIEDGGRFVTRVNGGGLFNPDGGAQVNFNGRTINLYNLLGGGGVSNGTLIDVRQLTTTSGTVNFFGFRNNAETNGTFLNEINPVSGNAVFNMINISPRINQNTNATGITRGILINPNLQRAQDFRAIEVVNGKVIIPNGTANNEAVNLGQLNTKLDASIYNDRYKGKFTSLANLQTALPTANAGDYAQVDGGAGSLVINYNYDLEDGWVIGGSGSGATNTDNLPEGNNNFYFTTERVLATLLSGLVILVNATITATDSVLSALGKLQKQITDGFTASNIRTILGITTLSGSNTGDQDLTPLIINENHVYQFHDFLNAVNNHFISIIPVLSGSAFSLNSNTSANNAGIVRITSSTTGDSGASLSSQGNTVILKGSEVCNFIINPITFVNTTMRAGIHNTGSVSVPSNGIYFEYANSGTLRLIARNNNAETSINFAFTLLTSNWYKLRITVNANATSVTGSLFNNIGGLIESQTIATSNIPIAQRMAICLICTNSTTTATPLLDVDFIDLDQTLIR